MLVLQMKLYSLPNMQEYVAVSNDLLAMIPHGWPALRTLKFHVEVLASGNPFPVDATRRICVSTQRNLLVQGREVQIEMLVGSSNRNVLGDLPWHFNRLRLTWLDNRPA